MVTPTSAPRVLDNEEVFIGALRAIADSGHTVIQLLRAAVFVRIDTLAVELEAVLRSINGNRDWANGGKGGLEGILVTRWKISETSAGGTNILLLERAFAVLRVYG